MKPSTRQSLVDVRTPYLPSPPPRETERPSTPTPTPAPAQPQRRVRVYIDTADWWVGAYLGDNHIYVCLLPTLVFRIRRQR
jgi:hypothetical protein